MPRSSTSAQSLAIQVFGVTVEVVASPAQLAAVREFLPPNAVEVTQGSASARFALVPRDEGLVDVTGDEKVFAGPIAVPTALGLLDARMRMHIALHAPEHIFVHAGAVGLRGMALLIPGKSFAGKTTLVGALVRAGAEYWSDEYAALDAEGRVHPYAKPLSVRLEPSWLTEERPVEGFGGSAGAGALPVGLIVLTDYRLGASWAPTPCSRGVGAVRLLEHTVPAHTRPDQSLEFVRRAVAEAVVLEGERGEAEQTATALMAMLSGLSVAPRG